MPKSSAVADRLSEMIAKQESLLSELQELAQEHCCDDGGDEDAEDVSSPLMTWVSTLAALEDAREALDDLIATVEPRSRCCRGGAIDRRHVDAVCNAMRFTRRRGAPSLTKSLPRLRGLPSEPGIIYLSNVAMRIWNVTFVLPRVRLSNFDAALCSHTQLLAS